MNNVHILMTLTSPSCPAAGSLPGEIEGKVRSIEGVGEVEVEITFDPPWSDELMSDSAKLELGLL
jgi:metal-sulfur cluster biosynthetic enzyme